MTGSTSTRLGSRWTRRRVRFAARSLPSTAPSWSLSIRPRRTAIRPRYFGGKGSIIRRSRSGCRPSTRSLGSLTTDPPAWAQRPC